MFNLGGTQLRENPFFELEVLIGTEEKPSFVSIMFDKKKFSICISLNEPQDYYTEVKLEDNVEILNLTFNSLIEATEYYNTVRNSSNIATLITNYKNKGK